MSSYIDFDLTLFRDSLTTPWGFRIEGGRDYHGPLTVRKVFPGSPAYTQLHVGDVLMIIQYKDATYLTHKEAHDLISSAGGSLELGIRRFGSSFAASGYATLPSSSNHQRINLSSFKPPAHLFYAEDPLNNYIRSRPIEKSRDPKPILSQTGSPIMPGATPSYNTSSLSVKRYRPTSMYGSPLSPTKLPKTNFAAAANNSSGGGSSSSVTYYNNTNTVPVPYGADKGLLNRLSSTLTRLTGSGRSSAMNYSPTRAPTVSFHPNYSNYSVSTLNLSQPSYYDNNNNINNNGWSTNSLRRPAPTPAPAPPRSPLPKAVNLQYNSPIGLYSNANIEEEYLKKVGSLYAAESEF